MWEWQNNPRQATFKGKKEGEIDVNKKGNHGKKEHIFNKIVFPLLNKWLKEA